MQWQRYQKIEQRNPALKNFTAAKEKVRQLRYKTKMSSKLMSSVSLPNFSRARLRHISQKNRTHFAAHGKRGVSEGAILLACLICLVNKLRRCERLARLVAGPRFRLYNEDKYHYEIVPLYVDRKLWLALQARALELEVSLSHLADLALRLYLQQIIKKLVQQNTTPTIPQLTTTQTPPVTNNKPSSPHINTKISYLEHLLNSFSYQKKYTTTKYGKLPNQEKSAIFEMRLYYAFGTTSPPF